MSDGDDVSSGIFYLRGDGTVRLADAGAQKIAGYSQKELRGKSFAQFIVPDDLRTAIRHYESVLSGEGQTDELTIFHKEGHHVRIRVESIPNYSTQGELVGIIGKVTQLAISNVDAKDA